MRVQSIKLSALGLIPVSIEACHELQHSSSGCPKLALIRCHTRRTQTNIHICSFLSQVGIDRICRFFQALLQIILSYPVLLTATFSLLPPTTALTAAGLNALRLQLNLVRRFTRAFRFLENFVVVRRFFAESAAAPPPSTEDYLDMASRAHNGMYLLLEVLGTLDACGIPGVGLWSPATAARLNLEAQRMWFLALACGACAGALRLVNLYALAPVPETAEGFGGGEKTKTKEKKSKGGLEKARAARAAERKGRVFTVARKLLADVVDMALPGSVVGWVDLSPGPVGVAMLCTTVLTSWAFWERCGVQVRQG